jgi:hypothetical protein
LPPWAWRARERRKRRSVKSTEERWVRDARAHGSATFCERSVGRILRGRAAVSGSRDKASGGLGEVDEVDGGMLR